MLKTALITGIPGNPTLCVNCRHCWKSDEREEWSSGDHRCVHPDHELHPRKPKPEDGGKVLDFVTGTMLYPSGPYPSCDSVNDGACETFSQQQAGRWVEWQWDRDGKTGRFWELKTQPHKEQGWQ